MVWIYHKENKRGILTYSKESHILSNNFPGIKYEAVVMPYIQMVLVYWILPPLPNDKNKECGSGSFLRDFNILQRYEKLSQMSPVPNNILKATVGRIYAHA